MKKINIIMDVDPGVDDIFAMTLAITHPKINLIGVTTTFGNRQLSRTNRNALGFLEMIGHGEIPVAKGSEVPLVREPFPYSDTSEVLVHGVEGTGYGKIDYVSKTNEEEVAEDFIAKMVRETKEPVTLVPVGPLTNIAKFITKYPELAQKVERICLMGGSLNSGNATEFAEFNIFLDGEAAKIVFDSGLPIVMASLEGTREGAITKDEWTKILEGDSPLKIWFKEMLECYSIVYEKQNMGMVLHDSLPVAYLIDETIGEVVDVDIDVLLDKNHYGQTKGIDGKSVKVITGVDRIKFLKLFEESIKAICK